MAVAEGEILRLLPSRDGGQTVLLPAETAKHGVDHAGGPLAAVMLDHLHRLADGGAVRHPVHQQDLVSPQAQHVPDEGLQLLKALVAVLTEVEVQQCTVLEHTVGQAGGKGRLPPVKAPDGGLQAAVGPGVQAPAGGQDLQGRLPARHLCRLSRPAKIRR